MIQCSEKSPPHSLSPVLSKEASLACLLVAFQRVYMYENYMYLFSCLTFYTNVPCHTCHYIASASLFNGYVNFY